MRDSRGEGVEYLRISLTDRCNLRCLYCYSHGNKLSREELLSFEEIERLVRVAISLGIRRVRLTGGEPLVRKGVEKLLARLSLLPGLEDISLTTNGILLAKFAGKLKEAGLRRVNISLDTLNPAKFQWLTGRGRLEEVLRGTEEASGQGLNPVKVNVVVLRNVNQDEVIDFVRFSIENRLSVRFIEFMPSVGLLPWEKFFFPVSLVKKEVGKYFSMEEIEVEGGGPAEYYRVEGGGIIGFIAPITCSFCSRCNRIRITPEGRVKPCLGSDYSLDLKGALRRGEEDGAIREKMRYAVLCKSSSHPFEKRVSFARVGG
ncbi:MAG: GTP 3',8-cyclase MoaA [Caldiserica bacterium]|nr:GTP 3',8-cyclase MoaA [Caldisericota bacterium]